MRRFNSLSIKKPLLLLFFYLLSNNTLCAVKFGNDYITVVVDDKNLRYILYTKKGLPEIDTDDNKKLLFERYGEFTSYTTVLIDGKELIYGSEKGKIVQEPIVTNNSVCYSAWDYKNILTIEQYISLTKGLTTDNIDTVEIRYKVKNVDSSKSSHTVGLRVLLDTLLGSNDGAPFSVPGVGVIESDTEFKGVEVPTFWYAFDNLRKPAVSVVSQVRLKDSELPDKIVFSNWQNMYNSPWEVKIVPNRKFKPTPLSNTDSAVSIYWEPKEIKYSAAREYAILYGIYKLLLHKGETFDIAVGCPKKIKPMQQFIVTCDIENLSKNNILRNVEVKISSERGYVVFSTSTATIRELLQSKIAKVAFEGIVIPQEALFVGKEKINIEVTAEEVGLLNKERKHVTLSHNIKILPSVEGIFSKIEEYNKRIEIVNRKLNTINSEIKNILKKT